MKITLTDNWQQSYWLIGLYYLVLLIIALSWTNMDLVEPNVLLRYFFLLAFVLPFIKYPNIAPAIITLFVTIRLFSIAPFGYLPSQVNLYLYFAVVLYLYNISNGLSSSKTTILLILFFLTILLSNLINFVSESQGSGEYNFLKMLLISIILGKLIKNQKDIDLLELSFIIITFCLSIYGFIFYKEIAANYNAPEDIKRIYWNDPNYLGCVLSIGIVISFYRFLTFSGISRIYRIFYLATFIFGIINLGFFASRGAFVTTVVPLFYILFTKAKSLKSILLAAITICIILFLILNFSVFNSLMNRFSNDTIDSGSQRTIIWQRSFDLFNNSDIKTLILGGGSNFSYQLCGRALNSVTTSPHNNYLEILYDYGIVGLFVFVSLLGYWFKHNSKNIIGTSLVLVLIISCLTLSPLMYLPFWFLILLIDKQALKENGGL